MLAVCCVYMVGIRERGGGGREMGPVNHDTLTNCVFFLTNTHRQPSYAMECPALYVFLPVHRRELILTKYILLSFPIGLPGFKWPLTH